MYLATISMINTIFNKCKHDPELPLPSCKMVLLVVIPQQYVLTLPRVPLFAIISYSLLYLRVVRFASWGEVGSHRWSIIDSLDSICRDGMHGRTCIMTILLHIYTSLSNLKTVNV